ncbi:MAG: gluconate 2-dehydrogenase subunit 3 family protein [Bryobacteraceae bacterium]
MADRREALRIIGAIGATCAFPFSSGELYGQHAHPPEGKQADFGKPQFFQQDEFAVVSRVADLIIPATETPGAVGAGVPAYIDMVVRTNQQHQAVFRAGLAYLSDQAGGDFLALPEARQIALLTPLSNAVDHGDLKGPGEIFFRAIKSMTADGYYTSKAGMSVELGYHGGTVLSEYPSCEVPEH